MRSPDFRILAAEIAHLAEGEQADVRRAFDFAVQAHDGQTREDGSPYVLHVIDVAVIVASWHADRETIIAALLHDVLEDTSVRKDEIAEKFGRKVALLVEGITKFAQEDLDPTLDLERKKETLRKLFDVMRIDIRSILIKLADRLHNVQTIDALPPERRARFAHETMTVYYKIAFHLGMRSIRREFAERCVPYAYEKGRKEQHDRDIVCSRFRDLPRTIETMLRVQEGGSTDFESIELQPRNLQIFHDRLVGRGGVALSQDAFSIVVIVPDEEGCYRFLKAAHTLFRPVAGQFRDFIAAPSDAGYRSLHTHVALPDSSIIEIRIYTPEMFDQAMLGIVHAIFGKGGITPNFAWLERTEELDLMTRESSSAFWEALESDILRETISVTVDRRRLSLPSGATALDAAYAMHDAAAKRTTRINVNGSPVTFSYIVKEDDEVHVTLPSSTQVHFDWLNAVSTRHARMLISDELKSHSRAEKVSLGAIILQKELDHYGKGLLQHLSRSECQQAALHFKRESFDQVLAMIGEGVIRPRDVLFFLFPEHRRSVLFRTTSDIYRFRLSLDFKASDIDPLKIVSEAATKHGVHIQATTQQFDGKSTELQLVGHSETRMQFADFVDSLERHESCTKVQTLIPAIKKSILVGSFLLAFLVLIADIVLLPWYQGVVQTFTIFPQFLLQALPLLPILIANVYLLRLMRHYFVRMRNDRWFLGVGFFLNLIGLVVLTFHVAVTTKVGSLLPLVGIFTLSLVYMGYRFVTTEALFAPFDDQKLRPVTDADWKKKKRQKFAGYSIRLAAVFIWGVQPILIRYTPINDLSPFLRPFLFGLGALIPTSLLFFLPALITRKKIPSIALPYDLTFFFIVFGQVGYTYFMNASLLYTSGTNLLLINNFAPLIALIVAAFFWRREIAYLKQPRVMLTIFLLAVLAGGGSSLLIQNSLSSQTGSVVGDILAMVAMFFDVLLVVSQIQYIKHFAKTNAMLLNLHVYSFILVCFAPIILIDFAMSTSLLTGLTKQALIVGVATGCIIGIGQFLNYEAFKRIDGYLAFMMFNISTLITFVIEAFFLHTVEPTLLLILSGVLIIGASVLAEYVNSRCERKGL